MRQQKQTWMIAILPRNYAGSHQLLAPQSSVVYMCHRLCPLTAVWCGKFA